MFFSVGKIFWLAVILYGVWMAFRIIEKRKRQDMPKQPKRGFFGFGKSAPPEDNTSAVDTRPCDVCGAFVTSAGCNRPECPVRQK